MKTSPSIDGKFGSPDLVTKEWNGMVTINNFTNFIYNLYLIVEQLKKITTVTGGDAYKK